jgi:hypothetical protein
MLHVALLVASFVLFLLAAFNVSHPRVNFESAGLACFIATLLFR